MRGANLTQPTHIADWYGTFCRLAGVDPSDDQPGVFPIDSLDLMPLLTGANMSATRETIVIGHEFPLGKTRTLMGAVIHRGWKLIVGPQSYSDYRGPMYPCTPAIAAPNCQPDCFFDLSLDPFERVDRAKDPSVAQQKQILQEIYNAERNSFQNMTVDEEGFEHAIEQLYFGYMGPWL
jgi:arylsulfatase B